MNRFCDLCGWETPSFSIYTRIKKKTVIIGYICGCCGLIHPEQFPTLFLLKEDALQVKKNIKLYAQFRPDLAQKSEAL